MKVGVVGCGVISRQYAENAKAFDSFELVACADLDESQAQALAEAHGLRVASVEELIGDPSIDVVLNLTPPAAHVDVIRACLDAGKHVYTEKPLATETTEAAQLLAEADRLGLRVGCAPDTFLGSAYQAGRALIDAGSIGEPLSVSAAMLVGGQEVWHPNPDIFFADGAGPLLDMGPYYLTAIVALLGPVARVAGFSSTRTSERTIQIGPRAGERFAVATPSHTAATIELENGVTANLVASFGLGVRPDRRRAARRRRSAQPALEPAAGRRRPAAAGADRHGRARRARGGGAGRARGRLLGVAGRGGRARRSGCCAGTSRSRPGCCGWLGAGIRTFA